MNEPWHIQLSGGLCVRQGERSVNRFRTQKTGALLAYLAYHRGHSHPREVLIEMFWPDTTPESGRHNLSHALSSLRSLLEPPGVPAGSVIVADRFTVELNPEAFITDAAEFEHAVRVATQARNTPDQTTLLVQALEKYGGMLLPEYYEDWIGPAQLRLAQRFRQAKTQAMALLEKAGDLVGALEIARRGASLDPDWDDDPDSALGQMTSRIEEQFARSVQNAPTEDIGPRIPRRTAESQTLPTGTVTVLMTDIEGSTALWEKIGDAFRSALSTHHALLRREFRRHGGHELKEAGDSFLVVFAAVADALECAISCQRSFDKQPWPETVGVLRVRMALHTGDVEIDEGETDEYHGLMLHRAARMLAATHGGQILCSEATAGLLVRDLEPQIQLKDLGVWRLRDVEGPERLYQISYPDMPVRDFPPLNATPSRRTHLPLQFTRFFGREAEIARIVEILSSPDVRLLTLTGPGGTGKTRLCIEGAGRFAESFDGAIWFVPLADLTDPGLIPQAILQAMGIPLIGSQEPLEQAVSALSRGESLLLLDNFEQLVDGGAEIVQTLLGRVEGLRCLVTSRQTLGLAGENEFEVEPLPTPNGSDTPERLGLYESVRLFVDRAQSAKPDFRITNGNAPAVAEICDRLEGIPLAIELAAARALVLSPAQMLAQLGNRFEFLVSRKRGVAERQRTLRAAVDWSYRLLAPDLQRFFAQLCVFRGGWTHEAAEAVCEEPLALDMLAQLRECSLVTTGESEAGIRFRMLETLREYAEAQLSEKERASARARHAEFFVSMAQDCNRQLEESKSSGIHHQLEAEHDNMRAVLNSCNIHPQAGQMGLALVSALGLFWAMRGYVVEGRERCRVALLHPGAQEPTRERARVLNHSARLAMWLTDIRVAELESEQSLAISRGLDDRASIGRALFLLATIASHVGEFDKAVSLFEDCVEVTRGLGDSRLEFMTRNNLGAVASRRGDFKTAQAIYEELLHDAHRSHIQIGSPTVNLGLVVLWQGDIDRARSLFIDALKAGDETGDRGVSLEALEGLAQVSIAVNSAQRAARFYGVAEALREEYGMLRDPSTEEENRQPRAKTVATLGEIEFNRYWQEGRAMTMEQAIAYALEETSLPQ